MIKTSFQPEKYLSIINVPDFRKNLTKLRISSHNLYVERGRYQIPFVSRENRWCMHCFYHRGTKHIEDETHVLINCPLYSTTRTKFNFHPYDTNSLVDLLSNPNPSLPQIIPIARAIHEILSINENYTTYYQNHEFYLNTGRCILL